MPCIELTGTAAQQEGQLRAALADARAKHQAVLILYGEDERDRKKSCEETTDVAANIRVMIWCRDASVIPDDLKAECVRAGKVAVVLGRGGKFAEALDSDNMESFQIAEAFRAGERQPVV